MKKLAKILPILSLLFLVSCAPKSYDQGIANLRENNWTVTGTMAFHLEDGVLISCYVAYFDSVDDAKAHKQGLENTSSSSYVKQEGNWVLMGDRNTVNKCLRDLK